MPKTFLLHDESVNTYGFRMLTSGAHLEEFRRNPVLLLNHDSYSLPIGRWENIRVEDGKILADAVFDAEHDPRAAEVAGKVERGMLRMASIGAWPPEEVSDDASLKMPGQTGPTVLRWTVREASICTIGSNHNALVLYDRSGERVDLSDEARLIALMDHLTDSEPEPEPDNNPNTQTPTPNNMSKLTQLLQLSDAATSEEVERAVQERLEAHEKTTQELETLKAEAAVRAAAEEAERKAEAVALIDAAVKDGRINAQAKEVYIKLFDADHEAAKASLEALPQRTPVAAQLETETEKPELSDKRSPWQREMERIRKH